MIYSRLFQMACAGVDPPIVSRARVARSTPHPPAYVIKAGTLTQERHMYNPKFDIQVYMDFRLLLLQKKNYKTELSCRFNPYPANVENMESS